jgi:predicted component of type VI protein secretion system
VEELITFLDDLSNVRLCILSRRNCCQIHVFVTQAGPDIGLASFVDQFLEQEKSWLKLQSELTQFIARLSQTPTASPLEEGQDIKGK